MSYYSHTAHFASSVEQVTAKAQAIIDKKSLEASKIGSHISPEASIHFLPLKVQKELDLMEDQGLLIRNMIYAVLTAELLSARDMQCKGYSTYISLHSTLAEIEHAIKRSPCLEQQV